MSPLQAWPAWAPPRALLGPLLGLPLALHLVALTVALGGALFALAAAWRAGDAAFAELRRRLGRGLAPWTVVAGSTGGAALGVRVALSADTALPAAVIMAWPWLSVALFLAAAVGGFALASRAGAARPTLAFWLTGGGALALGLSALVLTGHAGLSLEPWRHLDLYLAAPGGTTLDLGAPGPWPRLLHVLGAALAAGALWTLREGSRLGPQVGEGRARVVAFGARGLALALLLSLGLGLWALLALPAAARGALLGGDRLATGALLLSVLLTLSALPLALKALQPAPPGRLARRAAALAGHLAAILVLMAVVRAGARGALLIAAPALAAMARASSGPDPRTADPAGALAFAVALPLATLALGWLWREWRRGEAGGQHPQR